MIQRFKRVVFMVPLMLMMAADVPWAPSQDQEQQGQEQQGQEQNQKDPQQKKKKKGGFFGGLKSVTGQSSEQQGVTATAGSKTVGEGEQIGNVTPNPADRQQVTSMENYSVPEKDLKKFQGEGHLQPKQ